MFKINRKKRKEIVYCSLTKLSVIVKCNWWKWRNSYYLKNVSTIITVLNNTVIAFNFVLAIKLTIFMSCQKKKQYEIDIQRFLEVSTSLNKLILLKWILLNSWLFVWIFVSLQSLPDEERERVMGEEKLGGSRLSIGGAGSPLRAKSPSVKVGICKVSLFIYLHAIIPWCYDV